MKEEKFISLWNGTVDAWLKDSFISKENGEDKVIYYNGVCSVKSDAGSRIYNNYENVKDLVKKIYFKDSQKKISRYKRAAVIIYAVISGEDPLNYNIGELERENMFLKQRFALNLALNSILQGYSIDIKKLDEPIFKFNELGKPIENGDDDFLLSFYKDLYYSEHYKNFNVLTMANVFGLLVERASILNRFKLLELDNS